MTGPAERSCPSCGAPAPFDGPRTAPVVHCSGALEVREEWTCRHCRARTATEVTEPRPSCLPGPPGGCR
ncbi:hypothetical protein [Kitasatospora sp. NPDC101183]|uniref:hypothetical protein n=1 Tax=Kitasatospora sp. NPDC101183 TaxID=3364100 RepID=UPI003812E38A